MEERRQTQSPLQMDSTVLAELWEVSLSVGQPRLSGARKAFSSAPSWQSLVAHSKVVRRLWRKSIAVLEARILC